VPAVFRRSALLLRLAAVSPPAKKSERRSSHSQKFTIAAARPPAGLAGDKSRFACLFRRGFALREPVGLLVTRLLFFGPAKFRLGAGDDSPQNIRAHPAPTLDERSKVITQNQPRGAFPKHHEGAAHRPGLPEARL
jgi:hypothetical protein